MGTVSKLTLIPALLTLAGAGLALAGPPASSGKSTAKQGAQEPPSPVRMIVSATTERIPLPRTRAPIQLTVDALAHSIRLRPARGDSAPALLARVAKHVGFLCPRASLNDGAVELACRTARIEAQISVESSGVYLDINELRGLPWRPGPDAPPSYHYDPWKMGLGQSCPGKSPASRGECELKNGRILEAAMHFRAALETTARQLACVRLGDLSVATGDPVTGAGWYRRAGYYGTLGRVADTRLCELDGKCLASTAQMLKVFDSAGLPEPLRAEMVMRAARAEAYMGRLPSAAHLIARQVRAHGVGSICREDGALLCRRILVAAMRAAAGGGGEGPEPPVQGGAMLAVSAPSTPGQAAAGAAGAGKPALDKREREYLEELIETYLALPGWEKGPMAIDLAQAAAPLGVRLGAPAFTGNLLASLAPQVPKEKLADHLLLTAETFIQGNNWPRARIVVEYAQSRLPGGLAQWSDGAAGGESGRDRDGSGKTGGKRGSKTGSKTSSKTKGASQAGTGGLQGPRWEAVLRALAARAAQDEVSPAERTAIEAEFAATLGDLKRARQVLDKAAAALRPPAAAGPPIKEEPVQKGAAQPASTGLAPGFARPPTGGRAAGNVPPSTAPQSTLAKADTTAARSVDRNVDQGQEKPGESGP